MTIASEPESSRPLRVAMVAATPMPAPNGTAVALRELAMAVSALGHQVTLLTYRYGLRSELPGLRVLRTRGGLPREELFVGPTLERLREDAALAALLTRLLRAERIDLVHAHGYEATLASAAPCKLFSIPLLYSAHDSLSEELPSYSPAPLVGPARALGRVLERAIPQLADRCLPHSANLRSLLLAAGLGDRTAATLPFVLDVDALPPVHPEDAVSLRREHSLTAPLVLYTGLLDEFQRLDLLFEAWRLLHPRCPDATLLVLPSSPDPQRERALWARIREAALPAVRLHPYTPWERTWRWLHAAEVGAIPRPEVPGVPFKLLNQLAAGLPTALFASARTGLRDGVDAALAQEDTPSSLADAILRLLRSDTLRASLRERGPQLVRARHAPRAAALELHALYLAMLRERPSRISPTSGESSAASSPSKS